MLLGTNKNFFLFCSSSRARQKSINNRVTNVYLPLNRKTNVSQLPNKFSARVSMSRGQRSTQRTRTCTLPCTRPSRLRSSTTRSRTYARCYKYTLGEGRHVQLLVRWERHTVACQHLAPRDAGRCAMKTSAKRMRLNATMHDELCKTSKGIHSMLTL